jgi:hypothetical protein
MLYALESGVVTLPINKDRLTNLPHMLAVSDRLFSIKSEFHITIIGSKLGQKLLRSIGEMEYQDCLSQIAAEIDWQWTFDEKYYHVIKPQRELSDTEEETFEVIQSESIIQLVVLPGIDRFYQRLSSLLRKQPISPPAHVTLYVYGNLRGIGIADREVLDQYAVEYHPNWI